MHKNIRQFWKGLSDIFALTNEAAGAVTDDQLIIQHIPIGSQRVSGNQIQQLFHGADADLLLRLTNSGEGRAEQRRQLNIIKTRHGHVPRNLVLPVIERPDGTDGHGITAGDNRGEGKPGLGKDAIDGIVTALDGCFAVYNQPGEIGRAHV